MRRISPLALFLALLAPCAAAWCAEPTTAAPAPFAWTVEAPAGSLSQDRPSPRHVLMGSVHVLPASAYPLPLGLEQAYSATAGLVLETDPAILQDADFQKQMLSSALAPAGLKSLVEPALYERLLRASGQFKLPMNLCDPFKAWFCALSLELFSLQSEGITGEFGLDKYFYTRADREERPVRWLEEPQQQLELFTRMDDAMGSQFLASTLQDLNEPGNHPADVIQQWRTDDRAGLTRLVLEMKHDFPEAYDRLLANRNRAWLPKLNGLFAESQPQLVVVGAAHLIGPDGLVALLTARGWVLKPLEVNVLVPSPPVLELKPTSVENKAGIGNST